MGGIQDGTETYQALKGTKHDTTKYSNVLSTMFRDSIDDRSNLLTRLSSVKNDLVGEEEVPSLNKEGCIVYNDSFQDRMKKNINDMNEQNEWLERILNKLEDFI